MTIKNIEINMLEILKFRKYPSKNNHSRTLYSFQNKLKTLLTTSSSKYIFQGDKVKCKLLIEISSTAFNSKLNAKRDDLR